MTEKEAIKKLSIFDFEKMSISGNAKHVADFLTACDIGAKALEKQIAKKTIIRKRCNLCYKCPSCNKTLYWTDEPRNHGAKNKYCHECGQKIDWDYSTIVNNQRRFRNK